MAATRHAFPGGMIDPKGGMGSRRWVVWAGVVAVFGVLGLMMMRGGGIEGAGEDTRAVSWEDGDDAEVIHLFMTATGKREYGERLLRVVRDVLDGLDGGHVLFVHALTSWEAEEVIVEAVHFDSRVRWAVYNYDERMERVGKAFTEVRRGCKCPENHPCNIFLTRPVLHLILPGHVDHVLNLDSDLHFVGRKGGKRPDLAELWALREDLFSGDNQPLMALAYENQPTYLDKPEDFGKSGHVLGSLEFPGYNGGIQLMSLDNMRASEKYNAYMHDSELLLSVMNPWFLETSRGGFPKGMCFNGDQDLYSVLDAAGHADWFAPLPCEWNRQSCTYHMDSINLIPHEQGMEYYYACGGPSAGIDSFHICHENGSGACGTCKDLVARATNNARR